MGRREVHYVTVAVESDSQEEADRAVGLLILEHDAGRIIEDKRAPLLQMRVLKNALRLDMAVGRMDRARQGLPIRDQDYPQVQP